jgi:hypothetical protein
MALWYDCGAGLVKTSFARKEFGVDAYLFSSGPSLNDVDLSVFNDAPVYLVGINTTYPKVKPHMWIGMDYPKCFNKNLWTEPFVKILRRGYASHTVDSRPITSYPLTFFADVEETKDLALQAFWRRAHDTKFIWSNNTFVATLHILIWMGFKRIHLVGSDFGGGGEDYYDDSPEARPFNHDKDSPSGKISKKQKDKNRRLYRQQLKFLKRFVFEAEKRGVELISCTQVSPANVLLRYIDPMVAVQNSRDRARLN